MVGSPIVSALGRVGHGLAVLAQRRQRQAPADVGIRIRGIEPDGLLEIAQRRPWSIGDQVEHAPPCPDLCGFGLLWLSAPHLRALGLQADRQRVILDRALVVLDLLAGQPAELVKLGRRLAPAQESVAGPDGVGVAIQLPQDLDADQVGFEMIAVDPERRVARRQRFLMAPFLEQKPRPLRLVERDDGASRRFEPDRLLQIGEGPARWGGPWSFRLQVHGRSGAVERRPARPQADGPGELVDRLVGLVLPLVHLGQGLERLPPPCRRA